MNCITLLTVAISMRDIKKCISKIADEYDRIIIGRVVNTRYYKTHMNNR